MESLSDHAGHLDGILTTSQWTFEVFLACVCCAEDAVSSPSLSSNLLVNSELAVRFDGDATGRASLDSVRPSCVRLAA